MDPPRVLFAAPEIPSDQLVYYECIGEGCYGKVYRGECRGKIVAIKKFLKQDLSQRIIDEITREVKICCSIPSPNIVQFVGVCREPGHFAIVTEYMPKGNLETLLMNHDIQLPLRQRLKMARDVGLGMNWLHKACPPILHRDLKPSNILVDQHFNVKVCDFGLSCIQSAEYMRDKGAVKGTPLWMSPEALLNEQLNEKSDVYSFGLILWVIYTRQELFRDYRTLREFKYAITQLNIRPQIPHDCLPSISTLMQKCWDRNPQNRPDFMEIVRSLDNAIMEVTIEDNDARKFWTSSFGYSEEVDFEVFFEKFVNHFGIKLYSDIDKRCFQRMVTANENSQVVLLEKFGLILDFFSPIQRVDEYSILHRIHDTLAMKWFHGNIESKKAEDLLHDSPPGTFLVRMSGTTRFCFAVSKVTSKGSVNHTRFDYHPAIGFRLTVPTTMGTKLTFEGPKDNLVAFIDRLSSALCLQSPCVAGWPYADLFKIESNGDGYLPDTVPVQIETMDLGEGSHSS